MNDTLEQKGATHYLLTLDSQPQYLRIGIAGQWDGALIGEVTTDVLDLCIKHQKQRILVDARELTGNISVMERFSMSTLFTAKYVKARVLQRLPPCRFAFVGHHPIVDPNRFGETVAVNNGLPVKVFTDFEKAVEWLVAV